MLTTNVLALLLLAPAAIAGTAAAGTAPSRTAPLRTAPASTVVVGTAGTIAAGIAAGRIDKRENYIKRNYYALFNATLFGRKFCEKRVRKYVCNFMCQSVL